MVTIDIDGRIGQGWGGKKPNGIHTNVFLARRGTPTAAGMMTAFVAPSPGFTPVVISTGQDQRSYEMVNPPTIMLNKTVPADDHAQNLIFGAVPVGTARGVLDSVADGLLIANQETVVFVSVWLDPAARDETAVCDAAREAVRAGIREAIEGTAEAEVQRQLEGRSELRHPFYGGR